MRKLKYYLAFVIIQVCISKTYGQSGGLSRTSQNALAPIGQGVQLYTGTYSKTIPLASVCSGNLKHDIAISYVNGNGIPVNQEASEVGLGWKLVAGGQILREIRGWPDDHKDFGWLNKDISKSLSHDINKEIDELYDFLNTETLALIEDHTTNQSYLASRLKQFYRSSEKYNSTFLDYKFFKDHLENNSFG